MTTTMTTYLRQELHNLSLVEEHPPLVTETTWNETVALHRHRHHHHPREHERVDPDEYEDEEDYNEVHDLAILDHDYNNDNDDPYESIPDVLDSTSVKSDDDDDDDDEQSDDDDDDEEEDDLFDPEGIPMPRLSSSTIPIVMEVVQPTNGRYASEDPLFQGVCLYHYVSTTASSSSTTTTSSSKAKTTSNGSSSSSSKQESTTTTSTTSPNETTTKYLTYSWWFPSIFQHLLFMQQQRQHV